MSLHFCKDPCQLLVVEWLTENCLVYLQKEDNNDLQKVITKRSILHHWLLTKVAYCLNNAHKTTTESMELKSNC